MTLPLILPPIGGCGDFGDPIKHSVLLGNPRTLTHTVDVSASAQIATFDTFIKLCDGRGNGAQLNYVFCSNYVGNNYIYWGWDSYNQFVMYSLEAGVRKMDLVTTERYADVAQHYHVHVEIDATNPEETLRARAWINGIEAVFTGGTNGAILYPAQDTNMAYLGNGNGYLLSWFGGAGATGGPDQYLSRFIYDDAIHDVSLFGYFNKDGIWVPKAFSGDVYCHLDFADPLDLGKDVSGNGNHWTVNNITADHQTIDTPTNNYPVGSPLDPSPAGRTLSEGNLFWQVSSGVGEGYVAADRKIPQDGKIYRAEIAIVNGTNIDSSAVIPLIGVVNSEYVTSTKDNGGVNGVFSYLSNGDVKANPVGAFPAYGPTYGSNSIVEIFCNATTGDLWWRNDGVWIGNSPELGEPGDIIIPAEYRNNLRFHVMDSAGVTNGWFTCRVNFGQKPWAYSAPAAMIGMSSQNDPCPAILNPDDYFTVRLRDGGKRVKNLPWNPLIHKTLVLSKRRDAVGNWRLGTSLSHGAASKTVTINTSDGVNEDPFRISFSSEGYQHRQPDLFSHYLNSDATTYFQRNQVTPTDISKYTFSIWVTSAFAARHSLIEAGYITNSSVNDQEILTIDDDAAGLQYIYNKNASNVTVGQGGDLTNLALFHHVVIVRDGSTMRGYLNGAEIFNVATVAATTALPMNSVSPGQLHLLFQSLANSVTSRHFAGLAADVHFIDGQALLPTDFAYDNAGVWTPKAYSGLYGSNGWHLDFSDPEDLGKDVSGNGNHFTSSVGVTEANHLLEAYATDPEVSGSRVDYIWRANPKAGTDIIEVVHVTGTPTIFNHALGGSVDYAWVLNLTDGGPRRVFHHLLGSDDYLELNAPTVSTQDIGWFTSTAQDATLGASVPSGTYLIFMARAVPQFSSFPTYNGNGVADGPFIPTDFLPRLWFLKGDAFHSASIWALDINGYDNPLDDGSMSLNTTNAQGINAYSLGPVDFLSNGVKVRRNANNGANYTVGPYYCGLWAQHPGKFARAMGKIQVLDNEASVPVPYTCADEGTPIAYSALFDGAQSLTRTPAVAGNRQVFTYSAWIKRLDDSVSEHPLLVAGLANSHYSIARIQNNALFCHSSPDTVINQTTGNGGQLLRDIASWLHVMWVVDTREAAAEDRIKFYINGNRSPMAWSPTTGLNSLLEVNQVTSHEIGNNISGYPATYAKYYLADAYLLDGIAVAPTAFGYFNEQGHWVPKAYTGSYGTNGFHLDFSDPLDLGKDVSGNGNHWTVSGTLVQSTDTPTNNTMTLNPLGMSASVFPTISQGNTQLTYGSNNGNPNAPATFLPHGLKGYFEFEVSVTDFAIGVEDASKASSHLSYQTDGTYRFYYDGSIMNGLTQIAVSYWTPEGGTANKGMCAFDFTEGKRDIWLGWNGIWGTRGSVGDPANGAFPGLSGTELTAHAYRFFFSVNNGGNVSFNFGQQPFTHTVPDGFNTPATENFICPSIVDPDDYFTIREVEGGASITDLPWNPQIYKTLVLSKRKDASSDWAIVNTIRGAGLWMNRTSEQVSTDGLTAFTPNGYTIGDGSTIRTAYQGDRIDYIWRASAQSGMDILEVTHTNGVATTVNHAAGGVIEYAWVMSTFSNVRHGYHHQLADGTYFNINDIAAGGTNAGWFASTETTLTLGASMPSGTYLVVVWRSVPGFSSFPMYTGTNNADGPFIGTDFEPRLFMTRSPSDIDNGLTFHYQPSVNNYNPIQNISLSFGRSDGAATYAANPIDILSNGIKIRHSLSGDGYVNGAGRLYPSALWAKTPLKFTRAR